MFYWLFTSKVGAARQLPDTAAMPHHSCTYIIAALLGVGIQRDSADFHEGQTTSVPAHSLCRCQPRARRRCIWRCSVISRSPDQLGSYHK